VQDEEAPASARHILYKLVVTYYLKEKKMSLVSILGMMVIPIGLVISTGIVVVASLWCKEYCCR
jgi:hypothetical protein